MSETDTGRPWVAQLTGGHFPSPGESVEYLPDRGTSTQGEMRVFVQIIQGQVDDPTAIRAALDRWVSELASGATGWLGSTAGVTDDGTLLIVARFENEELARQNSGRPEQGQWWSETSQLFRGEVTFTESSEVDVDLMGDPDQAGFVQVIRQRVTDSDRVRELMNTEINQFRDLRPDLLGTITAVHDGGVMTTVAYFTSEEEARTGEQKELPPEMMATMQEMQELSAGEPEYFDLRNPWLASPGR